MVTNQSQSYYYKNQLPLMKLQFVTTLIITDILQPNPNITITILFYFYDHISTLFGFLIEIFI